MRYCWQIGDIEFCATSFDSGWLVWGTLGMTEIFEEKYRDGMIEDVMDYTSFWVRSYSESLYKAALNFDLEEFL